MNLTANQVAEISGVPYRTLARWSEKGVLPSSRNGKDRSYNLVQTVAVAFGEQYRRLGCGHPILSSVVATVANMSEEDLQTAFDSGRTFLIPFFSNEGQGPRLIAPPPPESAADRLELNQLDLELCFERVKQEAEALVSSSMEDEPSVA